MVGVRSETWGALQIINTSAENNIWHWTVATARNQIHSFFSVNSMHILFVSCTTLLFWYLFDCSYQIQFPLLCDSSTIFYFDIRLVIPIQWILVFNKALDSKITYDWNRSEYILMNETGHNKQVWIKLDTLYTYERNWSKYVRMIEISHTKHFWTKLVTIYTYERNLIHYTHMNETGHNIHLWTRVITIYTYERNWSQYKLMNETVHYTLINETGYNIHSWTKLVTIYTEERNWSQYTLMNKTG